MWAIYRPHWGAASLRCDRVQADTPEGWAPPNKGMKLTKLSQLIPGVRWTPCRTIPVSGKGWCTRSMAKLGRAIACWFIVAGPGSVLHADEPPFPGPGTRVRVSSSGVESVRLVGTLTTIDQESLTVVPEDGGRPSVVARQDIVRLERSVSPSRKQRGAWIGFGVGSALAFGKVALQGGCNDGCDSSNVIAAGLVALSTAIVGALASPGERWSDVAVERERSQARTEFEARLQVRLVPQVGRRVGLSLVASF
jgi:hypothetical protein